MKLVETTEARDLRGVLRQLFTAHCPPELVREQLTDDAAFPRALWQELVKVGVFELASEDTELDGIGTSLDALGLVAEEAGRVLCPDIVLSTVVAGLAARDYPGHHQLAAGELPVAIALWGPGDAHDLAPRLRVERAGDGWAVSGTLDHVIGAQHAEVVLATARLGGGTEPARTVVVAVPRELAQVERRPAMGGASYRLSFASAVVAEPYLWGDISDERLTWLAHAALALQAREVTGGCQAVIDRTVAYVGEREQFGRAIGTFQAVQHLVADMHIATAGVRLAAQRATFWVGRGGLATHEVATATMKSSDAYPFVTLTAHQLHGGMGYVRESDLHLWSERAVVLRGRGGNSDTAAEWLAEEVGL